MRMSSSLKGIKEVHQSRLLNPTYPSPSLTERCEIRNVISKSQIEGKYIVYQAQSNTLNKVSNRIRF